jgi:hypothetical protein
MEDERARYLAPHPEWGGLNKLELDKLANYNGEVLRGLLHSEEWKAEMERLQVRFNGE